MNTIEKVAEFHRAFAVPSTDRPNVPESAPLPHSVGMLLKSARDKLRSAAADGSRCALRLALEVEELLELFDAMQDRDLAACLDAQVDRRYIADGTTLELGLAGVFDEAFRRVHAANMAKLGPDGKPVIDASGKVKKPVGWVAPDLSDLVER